jgi:hypothetical protein
MSNQFESVFSTLRLRTKWGAPISDGSVSVAFGVKVVGVMQKKVGRKSLIRRS